MKDIGRRIGSALSGGLGKLRHRKALLAAALAGFFSKYASAAEVCECMPNPDCNAVCPNGGNPRGDGTQACDCSPIPPIPVIKLLDVYPVGAIYISVNNENPNTLFGGSWSAYAEGRALLGASAAYPAGSTGGSATHKLSTSEIPSHSHSGSTSSSSTSASNHVHSYGYMQTNNAGRFAAMNGALGATVYQGRRWWNGHHGGGSYQTSSYTQNMVTTYPKYTSTTSGSHSHSAYGYATGGSSNHNNMQPYLAVKIWVRTA